MYLEESLIRSTPARAAILVAVLLAASYAAAIALKRYTPAPPDSELAIVSTVGPAIWPSNALGIRPEHLRARPYPGGAGFYVYLDASAPVRALLRSPLWLVLDGQAYRFQRTTDITPSLPSIVDAPGDALRKAGLKPTDWDEDGPLVVDH